MKSLSGTFTILHGTRAGKEFKLYKIKSNKKGNIIEEQIGLPRESTRVFSDGSGKVEFETNWKH